MRIPILLWVFALAWGSVCLPVAEAQYPAKPVKLIVPFPPGGASDAAARAVAQSMSASMGQTILVENRPGASGAIAAQAVTSAPADGYTLLWASASMVSLPLIQKSPPFQSLNDLTPVSMVGRLTYCLFVPVSLPAKSLGELIAMLRAKPDALSYASGSLGEFMTTEQFLKASGARAVHVPYKGGAQAMPDLIAGRVQMNFGPFAGGYPFVNDGKLRVLAVLGAQRHVTSPDVPTMTEAGVSGVESPTWQAIFAPPKTPADVVARLAREIEKAVSSPATREQFARQAVVGESSSPAKLAEQVRADAIVWQRFVKEFNIPRE